MSLDWLAGLVLVFLLGDLFFFEDIADLNLNITVVIINPAYILLTHDPSPKAANENPLSTLKSGLLYLQRGNIKQFIYRAHALDKEEVVARILQSAGRGKTVIFTKTKRQAGSLCEALLERGFRATALHGDMSQEARERSMSNFRSGKKEILVATEVAARGIDVDDVTHVINYTVPEDEKAYLHRIGRTGRAGRTGIAVTFVDWEDLLRWSNINQALELGVPEFCFCRCIIRKRVSY